MRWTKKGLVHRPDPQCWWSQRFCLAPTPYLRSPDVIRVYFGTTDKDNFGRTGYVDVDAADPGRVLGVSERPALDLGEPGAFDDCGANPASILAVDGRLYLYYTGFQRAVKVPFMTFTGLAVSEDGGDSFQRVSRVPVLDRCDGQLTTRSGGWVMREGERWHMFYNAGGWTELPDGRREPTYWVRQAASRDGRNWIAEPGTVLPVGPDEGIVGFARASVDRTPEGFRMVYVVRRRAPGTDRVDTDLGFATSPDGREWTRHDRDVGIARSPDGWDSEMLCYPSLLRWRDRTYLFYCGNNHGREGFGHAVLEE